ncbi:MAG: hypothetical protein EXR48_04190 [Dehalococcoidia bacterium]|nr:hypothetical protein [Dehalococcoidia bacterium]
MWREKDKGAGARGIGDEAEKGHKATARYLAEQHKLSGWWSQMVVVRYEWEQGRRPACRVRFGCREADGDALLDADQLIINAQDDLRLTIPKDKVTSVSASKGQLSVTSPRKVVTLDLGPQAARWARELQTQK